MSDFKSYYPAVTETCTCGAQITFSGSDLVMRSTLAEWRTGHLHETETTTETDEAVSS